MKHSEIIDTVIPGTIVDKVHAIISIVALPVCVKFFNEHPESSLVNMVSGYVAYLLILADMEDPENPNNIGGLKVSRLTALGIGSLGLQGAALTGILRVMTREKILKIPVVPKI